MAAKQTNGPPKREKTAAGRRYGPGRPTSKDLEQRKTRILDIATELFLEKGFAETSLVDIAKQAGVATRTIYQHYGDKEAIFRAVIDTRISVAGPDLQISDLERSLFDVLLSTAHYICDFALSKEALAFQRLMVGESQRFPDLMQQIFETLYQRFHIGVIAIFEQLAAQGRIPAGNHTQSAKYFIDLLLGNAPMQLNMNWIKSGPSEEEIRDKIALYMVGRFGLKPDTGASVTADKKPTRQTARRKKPV